MAEHGHLGQTTKWQLGNKPALTCPEECVSEVTEEWAEMVGAVRFELTTF